MTEKLFTGMLSKNETKQKQKDDKARSDTDQTAPQGSTLSCVG